MGFKVGTIGKFYYDNGEYLRQGCQTRFGSGASSGKFNLKRAGPT